MDDGGEEDKPRRETSAIRKNTNELGCFYFFALREAMQSLKIHALMGKGIGLIDVHLLGAVALDNGAQLWARAKRLAEIATGLNLGYPEH